MKKCVVTGKETNSTTNNIPLSREARPLLKKIVEKHNSKIEEMFVNRLIEKNEAITEEFARKLAPKINAKKALKLLQINEEDISLTRAEVLGE